MMKDKEAERNLRAIARLVDRWSNSWIATAYEDEVIVRNVGIGGWTRIEDSARDIAGYVRDNLGLAVSAESDGNMIRLRLAEAAAVRG